MSLRRHRPTRRRLMLFPLMDMFFILLLFFLVTSGFSPKPEGRTGALHNIASPTIGQAQVLLQLETRDSLVWLDNSRLSAGLNAGLFGRNRIGSDGLALNAQVAAYARSLETCTPPDIVIVLRCPDTLNYGFVNRIMNDVRSAFKQHVKGHGVQYSLLPGLREDIDPGLMQPTDTGVVISW